ncbi:MAG: energy transducer TonB [Alphaproteobacteria bacterium]|nr:energy transducer TonB [Alphaproteobacteria bacterium]
MISLKIRFYLYLLSVATIFVIGLSYQLLFSNLFERSGTNGLSDLGLKLQIQLQQVPQLKTNMIVEKEKEKPTKFLTSKKDELVINKKKETPKKKKVVAKKKKKVIVRQQKRIYDKGRIGRANLMYAHKLSGVIQRNMIMPDNIYKNHKVLVRFRLNANGDVVLLNIKKSSGSTNIDKIALRTIRRISPFPKPPLIIRRNDMTFVIPMEYKLR